MSSLKAAILWRTNYSESLERLKVSKICVMREDVLIILNEREPFKQQMAAALVEQLSTLKISQHRIKPSLHLSEIIIERAPRVLILDYLLGDEGTALDILSQLQLDEQGSAIATILWTDEPSTAVAVQAMKLGAIDYIQIDSPKSLEKLLNAIAEQIQTTKRAKPQPRKIDHRELLPIAEATTSRLCLSLASEFALRQIEIVVLYGERGTGRNTIGRFIHSKRSLAGELIEIDLDQWTGEFAEICGEPNKPYSNAFLSSAATVVIDHAEFDSGGQLIETIKSRQKHIWPTSDMSNKPMLIIGTTDLETAQCWHRLLNAEIIELPALSQRKEDLLPLLQRLTNEAKQLGQLNKLEISPKLIDILLENSWPGNIKQLRSAITEALTLPLSELEAILDNNEEQKAEPKSEQEVLIQATFAAKSRWERYASNHPEVPSPLAARKAVDNSLGNYRIAAIKLGTGVLQIKMALNS